MITHIFTQNRTRSVDNHMILSTCKLHLVHFFGVFQIQTSLWSPVEHCIRDLWARWCVYTENWGAEHTYFPKQHSRISTVLRPSSIDLPVSGSYYLWAITGSYAFIHLPALELKHLLLAWGPLHCNLLWRVNAPDSVVWPQSSCTEPAELERQKHLNLSELIISSANKNQFKELHD